MNRFTGNYLGRKIQMYSISGYQKLFYNKLESNKEFLTF
ncbi:UNVERIFIED_CONTAM: hypothetical protein GTU68_027157 [Idotea baltica]|nr:hypothetical protein [Idotea baltica]